MQAKDAKPKKAAGKANKAAMGVDLLDLDQESPQMVEKMESEEQAATAQGGADTQLDDIFSSIMANSANNNGVQSMNPEESKGG